MAGRSLRLSEFEGPRRRLIERLRKQGIEDLAVLRAFDQVPRHLFVPNALRHIAYHDRALPIGFRQSISRPVTHALVLQTLGLSGREQVLEIGTGSGFQTALLSHLAAHVWSIERLPELARRAREALDRLAIPNARVRVGDGAPGWRERAPFDVILVSARPDEIPEAWIEQLSPGGRMLVPLGEPGDQKLYLVRRDPGGRIVRSELGDSRFVSFLHLSERGD